MSNYFLKELKSFGYAFRGIWQLFKTQNHAKIHLAALVTVVGSGLFLDYSAVEWSILLIMIAVVIAAEGFNTALEFLADKVSGEYDDLIKHSKDIAAGSVLILAICSLFVAAIIILPKILL